MDKFGTFVAQESLNHMAKTHGALLEVVKAILVQAVLQNCSMSSVVRVAHWLEMCIQEVVSSGPATFIAIGVLDRVMESSKAEKEWLVILDRLATALLVSHSDSKQPLLVVAALHPEAHLLAREVVAKTNLLTS